MAKMRWYRMISSTDEISMVCQIGKIATVRHELGMWRAALAQGWAEEQHDDIQTAK